MWKLYRIDVSGFPKYLCGHPYFILENPWRQRFLAHVKLEVPTNISKRQRLPFLIYCCFFICTPLLDAKVVTTDQNEIQTILQEPQTDKYKIDSCRSWELEDKIGESIRDKYFRNQNLGSFCLCGKTCCCGKNCKDWANELLENNGLNLKNGKNTSLNVLLETTDAPSKSNPEEKLSASSIAKKFP